MSASKSKRIQFYFGILQNYIPSPLASIVVLYSGNFVIGECISKLPLEHIFMTGKPLMFCKPIFIQNRMYILDENSLELYAYCCIEKQFIGKNQHRLYNERRSTRRYYERIHLAEQATQLFAGRFTCPDTDPDTGPDTSRSSETNASAVSAVLDVSSAKHGSTSTKIMCVERRPDPDEFFVSETLVSNRDYFIKKHTFGDECQCASVKAVTDILTNAPKINAIVMNHNILYIAFNCWPEISMFDVDTEKNIGSMKTKSNLQRPNGEIISILIDNSNAFECCDFNRKLNFEALSFCDDKMFCLDKTNSFIVIFNISSQEHIDSWFITITCAEGNKRKIQVKDFVVSKGFVYIIEKTDYIHSGKYYLGNIMQTTTNENLFRESKIHVFDVHGNFIDTWNQQTIQPLGSTMQLFEAHLKPDQSSLEPLSIDRTKPNLQEEEKNDSLQTCVPRGLPVYITSYNDTIFITCAVVTKECNITYEIFEFM